jgi:hypothetical protein
MNDYLAYCCEPSCLLIDVEVNHMEPMSYKEVIESKEKDLWFRAMNDEIDLMDKNNV